MEAKLIMLKKSVRLLLVLVTVGGGFAGILAALDRFPKTTFPDLRYVVLEWFILALFSLITAAGLIFVQTGRPSRIMLAAIAVQIPWLDLPNLKYQVGAALLFPLTFVMTRGLGAETHIEWGVKLASQIQIRLGGAPDGDWICGVNLFAIFLLLLWLLYPRTDERENS
jgi:hypothetical protein